MRKIIKMVGVALAMILMCTLFCCNSGEKNDREYQLNELVGTYGAERDVINRSTVTTYVYKMIIDSDGNAKAEENRSTYESRRAGLSWDSILFNGKVNLTKDNIKISGYSGFVKTDGNIKITLNIKDNNITFEKES